MLIKTIIDNDRKWEIYKNLDNNYSYKYYEYFKSCGWRLINNGNNYTRDAIEWEFDIKVNK